MPCSVFIPVSLLKYYRLAQALLKQGVYRTWNYSTTPNSAKTILRIGIPDNMPHIFMAYQLHYSIYNDTGSGFPRQATVPTFFVVSIS